MITSLRTLRPGWTGGAYVVVVAGVAVAGFASGSASLILLAGALALPASLAALPAYYAVYGLLALVPGANPSTATATATCTADGICSGTSTGGAAVWFTVTTEVVGVVALTAAALANVLIAQAVLRARRRQVA